MGLGGLIGGLFGKGDDSTAMVGTLLDSMFGDGDGKLELEDIMGMLGRGDLDKVMGLLGGSSGGGGGGPVMSSLSKMLAETVGLPPETADLVTGFVGAKMMATQAPALPGLGKPDTGDLMGLFKQAASGGITQETVQGSQLAGELAQKANLNPDQAAQSLTKILEVLGGAANPNTTDSLDSLLSKW